MRDPKRIKPFMEWLTKEWEASPDLRFGQMLINSGVVEDTMATWNAELSDYPIPHKVIREIQTWGSYGKGGAFGKKDIFIKDLETDHIKAILETQDHIKDTQLEIILKAELKYREKKDE